MKLTARNTHRDIAYFYVGLILSFSLSGIFLNHRRSWNPTHYTVDKKEVHIIPFAKDSVNDAFVNNFVREQNLDDNLRGYSMDGNSLRISFEKNDVEIDLTNGNGTIVTYGAAPLITQMIKLHKDTSKWWIYFSDSFGIAMFTLGLTGMFIEKGKLSFKSRGWKLALIGLLFPLLFLFLLS
ncbi:MAG TPA: PepSY-associated TM helix domain-containing protein [Cyclobacteriaceae bacterium]|jgi:hypothetical protein|nr:PepSY-associated TM helix domain-containing protein [Cyclobacteriaceae bacterium]